MPDEDIPTVPAALAKVQLRLLIGLRRHAQIGLDLSYPFGKLLLGIGCGDRRDHNAVAAVLPVGGSSHLVIIGQLQRVNHPQNFIKVTTGASGVGNGEAQLFIGINQKYRPHGEGVARAGVGVNHPIQLRHFFVLIRQNGIVNTGALGLVDVANPAGVGINPIDAKGNGLDIALVELSPVLSDST